MLVISRQGIELTIVTLLNVQTLS